MPTWQPIETAPKDRQFVDLWVVQDDGFEFRVVDCVWTTPREYYFQPERRLPSGAGLDTLDIEGWFSGYDESDFNVGGIVGATHWIRTCISVPGSWERVD